MSGVESPGAMLAAAGVASAAAERAPLASILMPLGSAVGYVAAVLLVKRASVHGVGLWRTAFVSNVAMGVCFAPLWLLGGRELDWARWWEPATCAALFFLGQVFTFMALKGDVSLATPVLGVKILFVAAASAVLVDEPVRPAWWVAAALCTAAIALLQMPSRGGGAGRVEEGRGGSGHLGQHPRRTVLCAAAAALVYAVCDTLVQRFTPGWGAGRFLPLMFGLVGIFSFGLVPLFSAPLRGLPAGAWGWLLPGAVLLAAQAASMAWTMGTHGRATAANILYGTRGLWSVLAAGALGAWLGAAGEKRLSRAEFRRRLVGAGLMFAAVALVIG